MPQTFAPLTPDLWIAQSALFYTNAGIFLSDGQAGLIDPGITPDEIVAIAAFVGELAAAPQVIVLTHSHWDHILGPEHFPGVKTVAQAEYVPTVRVAEPVIRRELGQWERHQGIVRERPFVIPQPDETFGEAGALAVGELSLRLLHVPGHAPDQLAVYHEPSGTLWASDILSDVEIPFAAHNLAAYARTLARLAALDIRALVPGHGRATTDPADIRARLAEDAAYLAEVTERAAEAVRAGRTVEEAVAACADMRYRHPEENAGPHRLNVESAYLEAGGAADPDRVGWGQKRD